MKFIFKIMLAAAVMFMMTPICQAENFKFVDAVDKTGYYVDIDSVQVETSSTLVTTIAVVKAQMNKMYVYHIRVNHGNQSYQILNSKILDYETREVLESNDKARPYRPYSAKSEMSEVVDFILHGGEMTN